MLQRMHVNIDFTKLKLTFSCETEPFVEDPKKKLTIEKTKICQQTVRHKCAFGLDTWPGFPYCP